MSTKQCPAEDDLLRFADASLSPEELARVEQHLCGCTSCARQIEILRSLISGIAAPVLANVREPLDVAAHVQAVMARLDGPSPLRKQPPRVLWGSLMVGAAAAAALLLVLVKPQSEAELGKWTARGGTTEASLSRDVGVQLYAREQSLRPLGPGSHVRANVPLTAGLRNLSKKDAYLLLFAIDSRQVVHWIAPQFLDPNSDPQAAAIPPSTRERLLTSSVVFDDLVPGALRVVSLISREATRVSEVEALGPSELSSERLLKRFPRAEIRQVTIEVTP